MNAKGVETMTALMWAATEGHLHIVEVGFVC